MRHVVIVAGHSGSGKTEYSRMLSRRTGWPLLDKDTITGPHVADVRVDNTADCVCAIWSNLLTPW